MTPCGFRYTIACPPTAFVFGAASPWSCVANAAASTIPFRPAVPLIHNSEAPVSSLCAPKNFRVYFSLSYKAAALRNIARLAGPGVRSQPSSAFAAALVASCKIQVRLELEIYLLSSDNIAGATHLTILPCRISSRPDKLLCYIVVHRKRPTIARGSALAVDPKRGLIYRDHGAQL